MSKLRSAGYVVRTDTFTNSTPVGDRSFRNIIGSQQPEACDRLVFACHFDSKADISGFVAATDSAVPCAMLLAMAEKMAVAKVDAKMSLDLIFFDGEEAFKDWSESDSLYGSRHLATKWFRMSPEIQSCSDTHPTRMSQIKLFVLLDLLGGPKPTIYSQYPQLTNREFNQLIDTRKWHFRFDL